MGEKIVIGPINSGLRTDREPFVIDNDSFPSLINAYQWRGRVKRKRGTTFLNRLTRYFDSTSTSFGSISSFVLVSGAGNLITAFSLQSNANIIPGTVTLTDSTSGNVYTDDSLGALVGVPAGSGTINYASGAITIVSGAGDTINTVTFRYYPSLPVLGLEDLILGAQYPGTIAFDTTYSYNLLTTSPNNSYNVSFYKNPTTGTYPGYVAKSTVAPTSWNGQDYQQFWTVNYQGALWATNGIPQSFVSTNIGMQFKHITVVDNIVTGSPAFADLTIASHGLVVGDFVFINEVVTTTGINFQTGYVTVVVSVNKVTVEFPNASIASAGTGGIAQYLTSRSDVTKDCLRWYDGDPTDGDAVFPVLNGHLGWVNFAPPISQASYIIDDAPSAIYYLVGAKMIVPFKDRLLFLGPVIQTSSGSPIYLQDTIIFSQNGTPFYTASYVNTPSLTVDTPTSATNIFHPILVPVNQTATSPAYFEDQSGFGGFRSAGVDQAINTVSINQDTLIIGLSRLNTLLVYTSDDIQPFDFYTVNSELGSSSTFSAITMDKGVITRGSRGYIITSQTGTERIDLPIPDKVFEINLANNGSERITSARDYINEWVYFTYPGDTVSWKFPNTTLQYNYRDDSWATFYECYTTYGAFRFQSGYTWSTIGMKYPTWESWNEPWNAGASTLFNPKVIGGNQQGFILGRDSGTSEGSSLAIQSISGNIVTCPNHCLNNGDYIVISGALGTISTLVNGKIFSVAGVTTNTFTLNPEIDSGTYLGSGLIQRMYIPFIQSKQFPMAWGLGRKTRIGPQQYLFTTTNSGQVTLLIYLSQNSEDPYNDGPIVPSPESENDALIYSTVLYTCPESTNLGLTPANTNLQMPTASQQQQIWHRMNTSLLGDTVQFAFTLSDAQMRDTNFANQFVEVEFQAAILDVNPSSLLS